jgi:hypothetical protein
MNSRVCATLYIWRRASPEKRDKSFCLSAVVRVLGTELFGHKLLFNPHFVDEYRKYHQEQNNAANLAVEDGCTEYGERDAGIDRCRTNAYGPVRINP